jgi:hypothetical protein
VVSADWLLGLMVRFHHPAPGFPPNVVDTEIARDLPGPGTKASFAPQLRQPVKTPNKSVLRDVFGILYMTWNAQTHGEHPIAVEPDELVIRTSITFERCHYEFLLSIPAQTAASLPVGFVIWTGLWRGFCQTFQTKLPD